METYLTSGEVARMLNISRMTLNRRVRNNRIPVIRLNLEGQRVRYLFNENQIKAMFTD